MVLKRKRLSWFLRLCIGLSLLILCSCDSQSNHADGTGSVSFNLEWKSTVTDNTPEIGMMASGDVCTDYLISTINATVYDLGGTSVATKSFNCSDHSGSFTLIPAGSGYRLVIKGMVSGNADWTGEATGLTITNGKTKNAGTITMTYGGSDATSPTVSSVSPDASVTAAPLDTTITATFNEAMNESTISTATFTLEKTGDSSSVAGQVSYDSASMTATLTPDADLEPGGIKYLATLTTDIQDIAGNPLAGGNNTDGSYTWTFITETASCTYTLSSASKTFTDAGGSGTITITTSSTTCSWTAEKTDDWITLGSITSGTGDGSVDYTVAAYTGTDPRSGNITIAGETFVVKQNSPSSMPVMVWDEHNWDEVIWQ
ncbi:MAG: hypothetical protein HF978_02250 [Desulfobacteraceae bacterium]|nr:Ig-like domain-containing protein [Desulfobacteraceae bacterium]MBC2754346.1 hypothetical protein [Desulfobacteraceae bacterium]